MSLSLRYSNRCLYKCVHGICVYFTENANYLIIFNFSPPFSRPRVPVAIDFDCCFLFLQPSVKLACLSNTHLTVCSAMNVFIKLIFTN